MSKRPCRRGIHNGLVSTRSIDVAFTRDVAEQDLPDEKLSPVPASAKFAPVCAVGASAGGIGALQALFQQLPLI